MEVQKSYGPKYGLDTDLQELSTDELLLRKERLEKEMESELHELQARYHAKRKAILDAIALKKNGTVQF
uniref:Non-specific serine/threonine protein kinase n=1 Tax=Meloidogyne javanica TaxID=6303 RepID=A0A915MX50_MELJA